MITHKKFIEKHLDIRTRSGYEWQALCPFHQDSSPSFSINIRKGLYICYACGVKGNMKQLAEHFNVKDSPVTEEVDIEEVKQKLDDLLAELTQTERPVVGIKIPERFLQSDEGVAYWIDKRLLEKDTVETYRLGYDDINDEAIIPLSDMHGRVLGLIRRRMGAETPRYMYPRGLKIKQCLFGADVAKREYEMLAMSKNKTQAVPYGGFGGRYDRTKAPALVITEGSVDAMVAYRSGAIGVAMLGARISAEQIEIIRKLAPPQIIVATDRDRAGREAEIQVMSALKQARLGIHIGTTEWDSALGKDLAELPSTTCINALARASEDEQDFRNSAMVISELRILRANKRLIVRMEV